MPRASTRQRSVRTVRRIFAVIPVLVFLLTFVLFAEHLYSSATGTSSAPVLYLFLSVLLRALAASLAAGLVCIAAFGFYKYLLNTSAGL